MDGMIEVTNVDMVAFVRAVYDLSRPQGMGLLNFKPGELLPAEARDLVADRWPPGIALHLDYVRGRACKMVVWRDESGRLWIRPSWFDHTHQQLMTLLDRCGIEVPETVRNSVGVN